MKKGRGKKRAKEREFVHCNSLKTKRPCVVYSLTQRKLASSVSPSSPVSLIPVTPHHFRFLMPPLAPSHNHLPKPCYHCLGIRPLQSVHKLAPTFTFAPLQPKRIFKPKSLGFYLKSVRSFVGSFLLLFFLFSPPFFTCLYSLQSYFPSPFPPNYPSFPSSFHLSYLHLSILPFHHYPSAPLSFNYSANIY